MKPISFFQAKYTEPHCDGKQVIVHLFEWPWDAVARECEEVLGPKGFCGVQVSNLISFNFLSIMHLHFQSQFYHVTIGHTYRKSSIRSRPLIQV